MRRIRDSIQLNRVLSRESLGKLWSISRVDYGDWEFREVRKELREKVENKFMFEIITSFLRQELSPVGTLVDSTPLMRLELPGTLFPSLGTP